MTFNNCYTQLMEEIEKYQPHDPEIQALSKIGMEEVYPSEEEHKESDNEKRDDNNSHLARVYQAVKDGEWTLEDFKDFVSVVRNEARLNNTHK